MKVERWFHRCTDIKCRLCLSKMWTAFGPFWPFLIGCMVSADYWLADYPELRRATKPSTIGGPLGEPGFCIFCSTAWQWSSHSVTLSHHNIHSHIPIKFYQFNAQSVHLSHIQYSSNIFAYHIFQALPLVLVCATRGLQRQHSQLQSPQGHQCSGQYSAPGIWKEATWSIYAFLLHF